MKRMKKLAVMACATVALFSASISSAAEKIRVFSCDEPVPSLKRGICANKLSADDFKALSPTVTWYYNWHYKTDFKPPAGVTMEFLPMMWGDTEDRYKGLEEYLAAGHKPRAVLALNEPNLREQAFITPERTAKAYLRTKAIADKYGIPTVGPHMALGSAPKDSISADDPLEGKKVTYGNMMQFLKPFFHYVGNDKLVGAIGVHAYGNSGELTWAANVLTKDFNKPIWMTEYAFWNAKNEAEELRYLIEGTDLMERLPHVHGYAWFKERVNGNPKISLFEKNSSKLTKIGEAYVALPVHDSDVYYRIPGKLNASRYVTMDKAQIGPTNAPGELFEMYSQAPGHLDYNLQVDQAGTYTVKFTAKGEGSIQFAGQSIELPGKEFGTVETKVNLKKGPQTLKLEFSKKSQAVASIEFSR